MESQKQGNSSTTNRAVSVTAPTFRSVRYFAVAESDGAFLSWDIAFSGTGFSLPVAT